MYHTFSTAGSIAKPDAIAVALFDGTKSLPKSLSDVDAQCGGALAAALKRGEIQTTAGTACPLAAAKGPRLFVLGLGSESSFTGNTLRSACSKLTGLLFGAGAKSLTVHLGNLNCSTESALAVGEGLGLGGFVFDQFRGTGSEKSTGPKDLKVAVAGKGANAAVSEGLIVAEAANVARDLAATPPNVANPQYVASYCRKMSRQVGLKCSVIDAKKAAELNMGGLTNVGKAGSTPPAMIIMEHKPTKPTNKKPILLVGKAVTFDTGGYNLKPTSGMLDMKYDKCGGMAVIGIMNAIARLDLPVHVVGIVPAAENMVDSKAYRPSDIITFYNGVTCEIGNTDAEGRLILADALAYGCKTYKPEAVIDFATLTGAVVVALGSFCSGVFSNDEKLYAKLESASTTSGEKTWRLPMWPEYREAMRGSHADIMNAGGREGGACTAAGFLSYFVAKDGDFKKNETVPWAHIDIAGVANTEKDRDPTGIYSRGPTGYGVRLIVDALRNWK